MQQPRDTSKVGGENGETSVAPSNSSDTDPYEKHFGVTPNILTQDNRDAIERNCWKTLPQTRSGLGHTFLSLPEGVEPCAAKNDQENFILDNLKTAFRERQANYSQDQIALQNDLLSELSCYQDLYFTSTNLNHSKSVREALSLHALNHVTKKRRRVLKNNEKISHSTKTARDSSPPEDVQDQGFTRPSILLLLPFRSLAKRWLDALISHTPPPAFQVENHSRFLSEYGLPPGTVDKFAAVEPGTYPHDHVETFQGNVDDNFKIGIKVTRKSIKLFAEFYSCDIIIASPLGIRMSIEKENNADFLSSIEIMVVDQMNTLAMQNWDHVQFVFSNLNKLPKESHHTDFSRVKSWYLDGHAEYLRQTILLSAFETPQTRSLFNKSLKNTAGKIRTHKSWRPVEVPEGVDQNFVKFDCSNPKDEPDKRFAYFTTQILPAIFKSAVQSVNTAIFIPSSFDFISVHDFFKKHSGVSFAVLSEYSSNQDISRARQAFFSGSKSFLLISERFHFYRRYKIRGIRNLVFYGPPDHPQFYTEFLSYPFLDDGVEAADVTCRVLYSKYDWFSLERIMGTEVVTELLKAK